jgi:hypothetical protein
MINTKYLRSIYNSNSVELANSFSENDKKRKGNKMPSYLFLCERKMK